MLTVTGKICDSHSCQRPGCSPTAGCQGHARRDQAPDFFTRKLLQLVAEAARDGLVLTLEQVPLRPLAMGHYETRVSVRAARGADTPAAQPREHQVDGLGVNRGGSAILCYAWGESDRPCARVVHTLEEVKAFIVEQWLGSEDSVGGDDEPVLPGLLAEIAEHDWQDDQSLTWDFEIGGLKLTDVFAAEGA